METFKQFKSGALVGLLTLSLTLGGVMYRSDVQALKDTNEKQDAKIEQLVLVVERLKVLTEVQVRLNEQLVRAIELDAAAHQRDSLRGR